MRVVNRGVRTSRSVRLCMTQLRQTTYAHICIHMHTCSFHVEHPKKIPLTPTHAHVPRSRSQICKACLRNTAASIYSDQNAANCHQASIGQHTHFHKHKYIQHRGMLMSHFSSDVCQILQCVPVRYQSHCFLSLTPHAKRP